jgi:hypothetical protein
VREREWQRGGQLPEVAMSGSTWRASSGVEGSEGGLEQWELLPVGRGGREERIITGFSDTHTNMYVCTRGNLQAVERGRQLHRGRTLGRWERESAPPECKYTD